MASYNNIQLLGNIGRVSVKTFQSGDKVVEASLATTRRYKDRSGEQKEGTQWHRLILRGTNADYAEKYVKTGAQCFATGEMTYRNYTDRDGIDRTIAEVQVLLFEKIRDAEEKKDAGTASPAAAEPKAAPAPEHDEALERSGLLDGDNGDVPF